MVYPGSGLTINYDYGGDVNVARTYAVNGLNQYVSAGSATFGYDANGNLTSDGGTSYVYDIENRLVSASGATNASLRYDPLGRLYETGGGIAGTTRFLYDGDELVAEYDSSGSMLRRYAHGAGVDDPLAWFEGATVDNSAAKLVKTNHQGSVIALTDWNGNLANINSYDEWGIPAATNLGRFQYTGQAWIPELGMYYYKARIYSPTLGRFLQTDPIGYDDQVNLYAYVGNDPVNKIDPSGEQLVEKNRKDREVVQRTNDLITSNKPQIINLDNANVMTMTRNGSNVNVTITHKEKLVIGSVTVTFRGTGQLRSSPGKVTVSGIKLKSSSSIATVRSSPTSLTLFNGPNGRVRVQTNGPLVVSVPFKTVTVPQVDKQVNR